MERKHHHLLINPLEKYDETSFAHRDPGTAPAASAGAAAGPDQASLGVLAPRFGKPVRLMEYPHLWDDMWVR